jgi:hypothetical protein
MARKKQTKAGYGKILDAWVRPDGAGDPVGCVATTFTFSPAFFEEECLGRFLQLDTDPAEDGPAYLVQREEKLAQLACAAVLVDQHHCQGMRSLRWDLIPARLRGGILHAKVSLLHWANWVRLIVASANLTEDGYRRNQEVFGVLNYRPGGDAPLPCLREMVAFLREACALGQSAGGGHSPEQGRWNALLDRVDRVAADWGSEKPSPAKSVLVHAVVGAPQRESVFQRLTDIWPEGTPPYTVSVLSPFFDPPEAPNRPAEALWNMLRRRGEAEVEFFVSAEDIPGDPQVLVHAPKSLLDAQPQSRPNVDTFVYRVQLEQGRPLHAKGIWLGGNRWAVYMIGSSNFTSAGTGVGKQVNLEANLAYCVDGDRNTRALDQLRECFPEGDPLDLDGIKWLPRRDEDEDSGGELAILPGAFGLATYDCDEHQNATVELTFAGNPPTGWSVSGEDDDKLILDEAQWITGARPTRMLLPWEPDRPPSGFLVRWSGCAAAAWWPVNVARPEALPPPEELKNLSLEGLINILTSAGPPPPVPPRRKTPGNGETPPEIDPLDRVDTSNFLLQRTRRVARALNALRERLERPVPTIESLHWRLRGPIGVKILAEALAREARSEEEKAFLLSELALELFRAKPQTAPGCLPVQQVKAEIMAMVAEIRTMVPDGALAHLDNLRGYVDAVFGSILA